MDLAFDRCGERRECGKTAPWGIDKSREPAVSAVRDHARRMLVEAEQWATLASLVGGQYPYHLLERISAQLSNARRLAAVTKGAEVAAEIRARSLAHLTSHIRTEGEGRPIVVFNGLSWPRTDQVRVRVAWPRPGTSAIALIDEWDRRVPVDVGDIQRHAEGSVASATLVFDALDIPPVGYRTYWLLGQPWEDLMSSHRPAGTPTEPSSPLVAVLTDRHPGHLPPAAGLVQVQPDHDVVLMSLTLTADGALVARVRETAGRSCRAEVRLFVPVSGDPLTIELEAGQTGILTGVPEPVAWAPRGPLLGPDSSP
jgi:hypothetical protein